MTKEFNTQVIHRLFSFIFHFTAFPRHTGSKVF